MGSRRRYVGTVISDKMQKTIIVRVLMMSKNKKYGRILKTYSKFKAHDEKKTAQEGDLVRIEETRPLSKDKRYRLLEIIRKVKGAKTQLKEDSQ